MVSYGSSPEEPSGEGASNSTSSWVAHRSYLAPTTLKRSKNSEYMSNGRNVQVNLGKQSESSYKFGNSQPFSSYNYNFNDEYDPRYPNDYERVSKIYTLKLHGKSQPKAPKAEEPQLTRETAPPTEPEQRLSGDEMLKRRLEAMDRSELYRDGPVAESVTHGQEETEKPQPERAESKKGQPVALKMMEKMGWKEGLGLGKNEQGMVTPLVAKATGKNSGIIVNALPKTKGKSKRREVDAEKVELEDLPKSRISVIVFPNKNKVDLEDLEEIASEYGSLINLKVLNEDEVKVVSEEAECSELAKRHQMADCQLVVCEYETEEQSERLISALNNSKVMESQVNVHYFPLGVYNKL